MKLAVQNAVEQQINHALFPGRNVEGAMLSVEVVAQSYSRAEIKVFALQRAMDGIQVTQPIRREIIKRLAIGGGAKRLAPLEHRLGIHANRSLVEFSFAVDVPPAQKAGCLSHRHF